MGNIISVSNKDGDNLGAVNSGLSSLMVVTKIAEKYGVVLNIFTTQDINKELDRVYNKCKKYEEIQLMTFINDVSEFEETDIKHFNKAIELYPEEYNKNPKKILIRLRDLLLEWKYIKIGFDGVN